MLAERCYADGLQLSLPEHIGLERMKELLLGEHYVVLERKDGGDPFKVKLGSIPMQGGVSFTPPSEEPPAPTWLDLHGIHLKGLDLDLFSTICSPKDVLICFRVNFEEMKQYLERPCWLVWFKGTGEPEPFTAPHSF